MGVLHFLKKQRVSELFSLLKKQTSNQGIHIFEVLLEGDPSQEKTSQGYYFKKGELKEKYTDWNILFYKEFKSHDDEEHWDNHLAHIVAMKI